MCVCILERSRAHPRTEKQGGTGARWQRWQVDTIPQYYHKNYHTYYHKHYHKCLTSSIAARRRRRTRWHYPRVDTNTILFCEHWHFARTPAGTPRTSLPAPTTQEDEAASDSDPEDRTKSNEYLGRVDTIVFCECWRYRRLETIVFCERWHEPKVETIVFCECWHEPKVETIVFCERWHERRLETIVFCERWHEPRVETIVFCECWHEPRMETIVFCERWHEPTVETIVFCERGRHDSTISGPKADSPQVQAARENFYIDV